MVHARVEFCWTRTSPLRFQTELLGHAGKLVGVAFVQQPQLAAERKCECPNYLLYFHDELCFSAVHQTECILPMVTFIAGPHTLEGPDFSFNIFLHLPNTDQASSRWSLDSYRQDCDISKNIIYTQ